MSDRRKRVYIAGPITRGDLLTNVNQATAAFVALAKRGLAPLCPHWSVYAKPADYWQTAVVCVATAGGNPEMTHAEWLAIDLSWVEVADAVLRLPGDSAGADLEVAHAMTHGIPVYYDLGDIPC